MRRGIVVLAILILLAVGAVADQTPSWIIPEGYVEVWVPVLGNGDAAAPEGIDIATDPLSHPDKGAYRPAVPAGVKYKHVCSIPSILDKTNPRRGHSIVAHAGVFVLPADVERITARVAAENVPIADKLNIEMARLWCRKDDSYSSRAAAVTRCTAFFADHAALWPQEQYKALGHELLRQAKAHGLSQTTVNLLAETYALTP